MKVHLFCAKSSPSCAAFALLRTAKEFAKDYQPDASTVVRENFYVDDCLVSVDDAETGKRLVKDLTELFSKAGFHLTKWLSTCNSIMESIPVEERANVKNVIDSSGDVSERVIGMKWLVGDDYFAYEMTWPEIPVTRGPSFCLQFTV